MKGLILLILDWFHDILERILGDWAEFKALLIIGVIGIILAFYYSGYKNGRNDSNKITIETKY